MRTNIKIALVTVGMKYRFTWPVVRIIFKILNLRSL